jgi:hypothetical protein
MKYGRKQFMKFSDKNTFGEKIESEKADGSCPGRTWDEVEDKELEMINGLDSFIDKGSQQLCQKSKEIMKQWRGNES